MTPPSPSENVVQKVEHADRSMQRSSNETLLDSLPHPTPIHLTGNSYSTNANSQTAFAANLLAAYGMHATSNLQQPTWQQNSSFMPALQPSFDSLSPYASMSFNPFNFGANQLRQQMFSHVITEERDRDSGNETGSSPSNTPLTGSPHSLPSRSNSFSVSSLLKDEKSSAHDPNISTSSVNNLSRKRASTITSATPLNSIQQAMIQHIPVVTPQPVWNPYHTSLNGGMATSFFYNHPNIAQMAPIGFINNVASNRELCAVCADKASGFHYGVLSCEGCKGFFRRSVQKNMEYQCHKNNECMVDRVTRNRCQKCRFDKCLQVGMCRETVRLDKNRKRKTRDEDREAILQETQNVMDLINVLNQAYKTVFPANCFLKTKEEAEVLVQKFISLIPQFMSNISDTDRNKLVQCGLKPFLILRAAFLFKESNIDVQMLECPTLLAGSIESIKRLKSVLHDFNILQDQDSLSILCAMILSHAPYSELESPKSVEDLSIRLTDSFDHLISLNENIKYSSSMIAIIWKKIIELFT